MKNYLFPHIILLIFTWVISASIVNAEDLSGHQPYKIITFNLSKGLNGEQINSTDGFHSLLITGSKTDIIETTPFHIDEFGTGNFRSQTSGFTVEADFKATSKISLHGALGVTKNEWDAAETPNYDSSWEANLGVIYRLFNNLSYEVHFGYMDPGDLFKQSDTYDSVESIIMVSNQLTMSF